VDRRAVPATGSPQIDLSRVDRRPALQRNDMHTARGQDGGKIVFVRFPLSSDLKALEDRTTPRAETWDRLLKETAAPGIYFEDFPELASFTCPEWSHLSAGDSVEFTKRLVPHLRTAIAP